MKPCHQCVEVRESLHHMYKTPTLPNPIVLDESLSLNQIKHVESPSSFSEINQTLNNASNIISTIKPYKDNNNEMKKNFECCENDHEKKEEGTFEKSLGLEEHCCCDGREYVWRRRLWRVECPLYPPPISCIGRSGKPRVSFMACRDNGRFVLKEIRKPFHEFLYAHRERGRLKLHFLQPHEDEEEGDDDGGNHGEEEEYSEVELNEEKRD